MKRTTLIAPYATADARTPISTRARASPNAMNAALAAIEIRRKASGLTRRRSSTPSGRPRTKLGKSFVASAEAGAVKSPKTR